MIELYRKDKECLHGDVFDWDGDLPKFRNQAELNKWIEEHRYEDIINPYAYYGIKHIEDDVAFTKLNHGMFSSGDLEGSYEWGTPQNLFDELNKKYWFDVDLAASCLNAKCEQYLGPREDIIEQYVSLHKQAKGTKGDVKKQLKKEIEILLREAGQDSLTVDWHKHYRVGWLNPPYGSACGLFVKKAYDEVIKGMKSVTLLLPARTDTEWFHEYVYKSTKNRGGQTLGTIEFLRGRLSFEYDGVPTGTAPFPSMVVHFYRYMSPYTNGGV